MPLNGINQLDIIGKSSGNEAKNPEILINKYDLVLALRRSAIEAMSMGWPLFSLFFVVPEK